jgi:hypothetical protein
MILVKTISQYNENNIFFCDPVNNNIIQDGKFVKILYSTHNITLNGIYLLVTLNDVKCEKHYLKYKCTFNVDNHKEIINSLKNIEEQILNKYKIKNKTPLFKIDEQLQSGVLKLFDDIVNSTTCSFILKISGVWETTINYGITYKFITV